MSDTIRVLKPQISVDWDQCMICRRPAEKCGRHGVSLPLRMRGGIVCDDCALEHGVICECCMADLTAEQQEGIDV